MSAITEEVQKLNRDSLVILYEIDATMLGGTILRFINDGDSNVYFGGNAYVPVAIAVNGIEYNGQGVAPSPTLYFENNRKLITAIVLSLKDLVGAKFTRIRTFRKHLDNGSAPDTNMILPKDIFVINRKVNQNKLMLEFSMSALTDQEGKKIPGRLCLRNNCTHSYRVWNPTSGTFDYTKATCPYTGVTYFDLNDNTTPDPAADKCAKHLSSCKLRFGSDILPTRAVPGIGGR